MKKYFWIFIICLGLLAIIILWPRVVVQTNIPTQALPASAYKTTPLIMDGQIFTAEISDTPALQQLGLSYRTVIAPTDAMLFVFPQPANLQFWMKDMNFPLDIIWLDSNKQVIYIEQNLSPSTYPQSFGPSENSQYVIEVAAGTAARLGLSVGDKVSF